MQKKRQTSRSAKQGKNRAVKKNRLKGLPTKNTGNNYMAISALDLSPQGWLQRIEGKLGSLTGHGTTAVSLLRGVKLFAEVLDRLGILERLKGGWT